MGGLDQVSSWRAGQAQVADNDVDFVEIEFLFCFRHRASFADLVAVAFEQAHQCAANDFLVFYDQNVIHRGLFLQRRRRKGDSWMNVGASQAISTSGNTSP